MRSPAVRSRSPALLDPKQSHEHTPRLVTRLPDRIPAQIPRGGADSARPHTPPGPARGTSALRKPGRAAPREGPGGALCPARPPAPTPPSLAHVLPKTLRGRRR